VQDRWIDIVASYLALPTRRRAAVWGAVTAAGGAALRAGFRRAWAATTAYPDLRVEPAEDLDFGEEEVDGVTHQVLRFASAVWNAGAGALEVRAGQGNDRTVQVLYDRAGRPSHERELPRGVLEYHLEHGHWHFNNWVHHRLFRRGSEGQWHPVKQSSKQSFCIRDDFAVSPPRPNQGSQTYTRCDWEEDEIVEGLSVGWTDRYPNTLPGQWFDLGTARLRKGRYLIRSEVDPLGRLAEGNKRRNGGTAECCFRVDPAGAIRITRCRRT
jgi:hypothetical protein